MNELVQTYLIHQSIISFALVLCRVSAFVVASPMFGQGTVPNMTKLSLCISLSLFWMPSDSEIWSRQIDVSLAGLVTACGMEFIVGISLGYLVRMILLPIRIAGSYVGQELGFNLGQVADPTTGAATNEAGIVFDAFGLVLFWMSDVHHTAFRMLGVSFQAIRGDRDFIYGMAPMATDLMSRAHELGVMMIAPLASIMFLTMVGLMIVMRSWPQITLFTFGVGARLLLGLAAFFVLIPVMLENFSVVFENMADSIMGSILAP